MTKNTNCLNCDAKISEKFCSNCGQSTDTHRIQFKHFIFHDILHGVLHFEKGIFFTMKQALLRPGAAALEYIQGKRIRYYNVFYLTLLIIGANMLLIHFQNELSIHYLGKLLTPEVEDESGRTDFIGKYYKLLIFSLIPLLAFNSFLLFKKRQLNFSEHIIIAGMIFLGVMIIQTISELLFFLEFLAIDIPIFTILNFATPITLVLFTLTNYYRTFKSFYSKREIFFRITGFTLLFVLELSVFILLLIFYYRN